MHIDHLTIMRSAVQPFQFTVAWNNIIEGTQAIDGLTFDEMLGFVVSATMPHRDGRPLSERGGRPLFLTPPEPNTKGRP